MHNDRQYTIQFLQDMDWIRVTAIYDSIESVLQHGKDLLGDGYICRVLMREDDRAGWYTIKIGLSGQITSNLPVWSCPK